MALTFNAWLAEVTQLADLLYSAAPGTLRLLEAELVAGYEAGDSPAECAAGLFGGDES